MAPPRRGGARGALPQALPAIQAFFDARSAMLAAFHCALPFLAVEDAALEIDGTTNAVRQLAAMQRYDRGADDD